MLLGSSGGDLGVIWGSSGDSLGVIRGYPGVAWGSSEVVWESPGGRLGTFWGVQNNLRGFWPRDHAALAASNPR